MTAAPKRTAHAHAIASPVPTTELCIVCGRQYQDGKHHQSPGQLDRCGVTGCKLRLLERCVGLDGRVLAERCRGGHTRRVGAP